MPYTYEEAKQIVYEKCLKKGKKVTEAVIFDDLTQETSFGWAFYYNSRTYQQTRDEQDAWVGPGPILFNRETGEIKVHGSGWVTCELIEDYEFEIEAGKSNSEWVIELTQEDFKKTALKLRQTFGLDGREALALAKQWSPYYFIGKKRDLQGLCESLIQNGLIARVLLLDKDRARQNCLVWKSAGSPHDGYIRSLRTLHPAEAYERKDLDRKEVFIEGVVSLVNGVSVAITPGNLDRYVCFRQKEIIEKLERPLTSWSEEPSEFIITFKGTLRFREARVEVDDISRFQLTHSVHGYGYGASVSKPKER